MSSSTLHSILTDRPSLLENILRTLGCGMALSETWAVWAGWFADFNTEGRKFYIQKRIPAYIDKRILGLSTEIMAEAKLPVQSSVKEAESCLRNSFFAPVLHTRRPGNHGTSHGIAG